MRDAVIKKCKELLVELNESPEIYNWNDFSNLDLLEFYGDLRIELETEEYDDGDIENDHF